MAANAQEVRLVAVPDTGKCMRYDSPNPRSSPWRPASEAALAL